MSVTRRERWLMALATVAVLVIGVATEFPNVGAVFTPTRVFFIDPDDYTRCFRARQIAEGRTWRVRFSREINAPAGVEMHWTAPMDYLVAGAAVVFGPFVRQADSFDRIAACIPPAFGLIYAVLMMRLVGGGVWTRLAAGLMVVLSPPWHRAFAVGHPDHQCLLELCFLVAVSGWLAPISPRDGPPTRARVTLAGLAMGLAIWVSPLALPVCLMLHSAVLFSERRAAPEARQAWAPCRRIWGRSIAGMVIVGWLVENAPNLGGVAIDKISLVHVFLATLGCLIPGGSPATSGARVVRAVGIVCVAGLAAWIGLHASHVFEWVRGPEFLRWSEGIAELHPLITRAAGDFSVKPLFRHLGVLPFALPVLLWEFLRSTRAGRLDRCILAPAAILLAGLSIVQRRWLDHVNLALVPVTIVGLEQLFRLCGASFTAPRRHAWLTPAAALALLAPAAWMVVSLRGEDAQAAHALSRRTEFVAEQIKGYESTHPRDPAGRAILCEEGDGPMLLYRTGLPVVAAPYHRALAGILSSARFFAGRDPLAARAALDSLGVRYVVVPFRPHEQLLYFERLAFGEPRSFDPPMERIDADGQRRETLRYRPGYSQTMAYRLAMAPAPGVPRLALLARIREGAATQGGLSGLIYVVVNSK